MSLPGFLAYILLAGAALGVGACGVRTAGVSTAGTGGLTGDPALSGACAGNTNFQVGSGIYDITGPAAELGMMGYGMIDQKTAQIGRIKTLFAPPPGRPPPAAAPRVRRCRRPQRPAVACHCGPQQGVARHGAVWTDG
jgi:hypothetical protein